LLLLWIGIERILQGLLIHCIELQSIHEYRIASDVEFQILLLLLLLLLNKKNDGIDDDNGDDDDDDDVDELQDGKGIEKEASKCMKSVGRSIIVI